MIICLDYGERWIGVAVTDDEDKIALRHSTIDQKNELGLERVVNLIKETGAQKVLIGVPLSLSGEESDQTHLTLAFMEKLRGKISDKLEVEGVDEMFSSKEAKRLLVIEGKRDEEEHQEAARLILESYLRG